jgi:hypothetical protein
MLLFLKSRPTPDPSVFHECGFSLLRLNQAKAGVALAQAAVCEAFQAYEDVISSMLTIDYLGLDVAHQALIPVAQQKLDLVHNQITEVEDIMVEEQQHLMPRADAHLSASHPYSSA